MKTKLLKPFLVGLLLQPILISAQVSTKLAQNYPPHIVFKIEDIVSKVNLSEDIQIKIAKKLFTKDSLVNLSLKKGESISKLKPYYLADKAILKPILSAEEYDTFEYETEKDNRFLVALQFKNILKLKDNQIAIIRKQKDDLYTKPKETKKETINFYNNSLSEVLSKEQYNSLLQIIYKDQSVADAKKDWERIKQLKLVSSEKNDEEYNKIENYHSIKNGLLDIDSERYDKKKLEKLDNEIVLQEPPILIRANILSAGTFKDNVFSSIIKYEKEIKLTEVQIDTILEKYKELELIRFENEERDLTSKLPLKEPSQYDNIIKILSPEQIDKWLANKNKNQATKVALKNWKKLEMEGLTKNLNKDAVVLDFTNYQIRFLIADEKARMYNTSEYAFYKRDIEQKKPELLKKLDAIAKDKSKGITTKNGLTW